jgi:hypothetical protein
MNVTCRGVYLPNYTIDEYGNVFNINENIYMIPYKTKSGSKIRERFKFRYEGKWIRDYKHRLVAEHFLPKPTHLEGKLIVINVDGDTTNNHKDNLMWSTMKGRVKGNSEESLRQNHRKIFESYFGKITKGNEIHHIDHNHYNDSINNLMEVTRKEHKFLHRKINSYLKDKTRDEIRIVLDREVNIP